MNLTTNETMNKYTTQHLYQQPISLDDKYNMEDLANLLHNTFARPSSSATTENNDNNRHSHLNNDHLSGNGNGNGHDGNGELRTVNVDHARSILNHLLASLESHSTHGTYDSHDSHGGFQHPHPTAPTAKTTANTNTTHTADEQVTIRVHRAPNAKLPTYGSTEAAGADISALNGGVINPGQRVLIATGLRMEIPQGYEIQIRPRSGLALKKGITMLNTPGTIDSDYRGEIGLIAINHSQEVFRYEKGDRLAQAIVAPVLRATFADSTVQPLTASERGSGGFGSTGIG